MHLGDAIHETRTSALSLPNTLRATPPPSTTFSAALPTHRCQLLSPTCHISPPPLLSPLVRLLGLDFNPLAVVAVAVAV
jgi:hypothetical protein